MTREESIKRLDEQAFKELEEKIKFDKQTKKWFAKNFSGQATVMKCEKCGLFFKPSLGHKCKGEVMIDLQECVNKFIESEEKRKMQEMKQKELIKEAVMIMHPKHKGVVMQAGLKNVIFSKACEEDKSYLVTDERLAQAIRDYQDSLYIKESK